MEKMDIMDVMDTGAGKAAQATQSPEGLIDRQDIRATTTFGHEQESRGRRKTHQRLVTAVRVSDMISPGSTHAGPNRKAVESDPFGDVIAEAQPASGPLAMPRTEYDRRQSNVPGDSPDAAGSTVHADESASSSGSSSTITVSSFERRGSRAKRDRKSKDSPTTGLDVLKYLDPDSPPVSCETIRETVENAAIRRSSVSPTSTYSSSPSTTSSRRSRHAYSDDMFETAEHDTDRSTSPEQSSTDSGFHMRPAPLLSRRYKSYGTPEMPRGSAALPHVSPKVLAARVSGQGHGHITHLPRAEKLPLSGYEQLASQLASQGSGRSGPNLRPIYRRFEMLNHRLLLHLQDELCELEEQLHRLDTADTQTRRVQNCILPASRRAEALAGGELQWHKTEVLGKIGFKLEQYNRVLSSFKSTEGFQTPAMADIHEYRGYLATHDVIAEAETHFLDQNEDLICLGSAPESSCDDEDMIATPMPRRGSILNSLADSFQPNFPTVIDEDDTLEHSSFPIKIAVAVAVLVPTLTFIIIPGYLGRMAVVILVGLGVLGALLKSRMIELRATRDFCLSAGTYGVFMAVIAGICR